MLLTARGRESVTGEAPVGPSPRPLNLGSGAAAESPPEQIADLGSIRRSQAYLPGLVDAALQFAKVQAGSDTNAGIGRGLAISRELSRGMGGELSASNVANGGCSFLLTLPLRREGPLPIPTAKR